MSCLRLAFTSIIFNHRRKHICPSIDFVLPSEPLSFQKLQRQHNTNEKKNLMHIKSVVYQNNIAFSKYFSLGCRFRFTTSPDTMEPTQFHDITDENICKDYIIRVMYSNAGPIYTKTNINRNLLWH